MSFLSYPRGRDMKVMDIARKAIANVRAQKGGSAGPASPATVRYDKNDGNDQSPPRPLVLPDAVPVTNAADLPTVATAVSGSSLVGLDIETTGLDPRADRVRLLSLACDTT